ncbi:TetR/AcrR family transcriptional regulator [Amorphus sp. 3PC139-8]|uniref:TetR/AcrR family transcriptional regulator n=1 Tax=Amorphus sp. 3PC139-8 TaxID=2735676 RepID=UPI00345CBB78
MESDGGTHSPAGIRGAAITKTTAERLIEAAADLLDSGGEGAVTLRAVGSAAGVSHNAPYKHFANRSALLAAVATASFRDLAMAMQAIRQASTSPKDKLSDTIALTIDFHQKTPARYRLLFNNPDTASADGELRIAATETFEHLRAIVEACQQAGYLPDAPSHTLASLIFASAHGLLAIESDGAMRPEKGLSTVATSMELLLSLLSRR